MAFPGRSAVWGATLATWEAALSLGRGLLACLPAWKETKLLPAWGLLPSWERPSLEEVLLEGAALVSLEAVLSWGRGVPACEELAITLVDCEVSQLYFLPFCILSY